MDKPNKSFIRKGSGTGIVMPKPGPKPNMMFQKLKQ